MIYDILVNDKARIIRGVMFTSPSFTRMVQAGW